MMQLNDFGLGTCFGIEFLGLLIMLLFWGIIILLLFWLIQQNSKNTCCVKGHRKFK